MDPEQRRRAQRGIRRIRAPLTRGGPPRPAGEHDIHVAFDEIGPKFIVDIARDHRAEAAEGTAFCRPLLRTIDALFPDDG